MLYKNVFRTLKKQTVQLLLLGVMILLSSFIYAVMEYGISGVMEPTEEYFVESNQEDFSISMINILVEDDMTYIMSSCPNVTTLPQEEWPFTLSGLKNIDADCYRNIIDNRTSKIRDEYDNITLEVRESKDVYFSTNNESYRIRFLKDMTSINTSFFVKGTAPQSNNEIAVAETFAKKNQLEVGSILTINDKDYTISGFVLFPDYNLPMFGSDFILDNKTQTVALLTDEEFYSLEESIQFEIAGVFDNDYTKEEFETDVIDTYRDKEELNFVTNVVLTENNTRSGAIYAELSGGRAQGIIFSLLIASIALLIVGIMVSRVLQSQRGPIGILKSMGYSNTQITIPYIIFISLMALPIVFIGYYLGLYMGEPFKQLFMEFYLLPSQPIEQIPRVFIVSVVVPFVFIVGLSYFIIRRLLRKKPVDLLNPEVTSKTNKITERISGLIKGLNITSKLQQLLLFRNIIKFSVFIIGMFYAGFLILLSFSFSGIFDRMLYDYYEQTNHEYIAYCDYQDPCELTGNMEEVIELPGVIIDGDSSIIVGLNLDTELHPLYNKKNVNITSNLEDGLIITESLRLLAGLNLNDTILLEVGTEEVELKVTGITDEYSGRKAYINREDIALLLTDDNTYYNTVYSDQELDKDNYLAVLTIQDIIDQSISMQNFMNATVNILTAVSILIGSIIVFILTSMTIEDNFYNISLFKVLGYNNKEINKMIIGGFRLYGIIIFIIVIPIAIVSFNILEYYMAQYYDLLFPLDFAWWHGVVGFIIYIVIFYVGAFNAQRKLTNVSLQEAMKRYRV